MLKDQSRNCGTGLGLGESFKYLCHEEGATLCVTLCRLANATSIWAEALRVEDLEGVVVVKLVFT